MTAPDLRPLWIAGRFLTRLPFPDPGTIDGAALGRALPWYPAVGLVIGLILAVAGWLLSQAPAMVAAAMILLLWTWSTGALHLDGLADTVDAWVGGIGDRERTLAIMKDPASGPAGVTALILALITKLACLQSLLTAGVVWQLLWVPVLARATLPLLFATTPYVRPGGLGEHQSRNARLDHCRLAAAAPAGAAVLFLWPSGLALIGAVALLYLAVRRALIQRLGGFTGDTAGAVVELSELVALLVLALDQGA